LVLVSKPISYSHLEKLIIGCYIQPIIKENEQMANQPYVNARDVEGVQHCHGEICDEYYYRPLVYGKDLFTYIAHIPPGGGVPPDQEESDMYELSLYIIDGQPLVLYGGDKFTMQPHAALHCQRGVPLGFENPTDKPVTLILSFTPSPRGAINPDETRALVEERGRSVFSPESMNDMAGGILS
jgi:quercetin dioxygenase-like cupin family protein